MHPASLVRLDSTEKTVVADKLPSRLKVLSWGANKSSKGTWLLNETSVAQLPLNQLKSNFDRVALDFNHNSVPGSESYKGEPVLVAAHGTPNLIANDGLYLEDLSWTAEGKSFVGGRHYIDLSPTILPNDKGEVLFLHSAAVCRQGAIAGLSILNATPQLSQLITNMTDYRPLVCTLLGLSADAPYATITAAADKFAAAKSHKATLAKLLKLSADATDAEIETAATEFAKKNEGDSKAEGEMETLAASLKTLQADLTALKTNAAKLEIDSIKAGAAAEGKVIPAEILAGPVGSDPAQLRALAASLPSTVPLDQRTSTVPAKTGEQLVTNGAEAEVRKTLGISEDAWKKHNSAK